MTFHAFSNAYPLTTIVGLYNKDQTFAASKLEDVIDIDQWDYAPLDWGDGILPFIYYNGEIFECWYFVYERVKGYFTSDGKDWQLVTHSLIVDPTFYYNKDNIVLVPENTGDYEEMIEIAARNFNPDEYEAGNILTSYDAVKNFVARMEEKKNGNS